jgi:hypothetical protein
VPLQGRGCKKVCLSDSPMQRAPAYTEHGKMLDVGVKAFDLRLVPTTTSPERATTSSEDTRKLSLKLTVISFLLERAASEYTHTLHLPRIPPTECVHLDAFVSRARNQMLFRSNNPLWVGILVQQENGYTTINFRPLNPALFFLCRSANHFSGNVLGSEIIWTS